MRKIVLTALFVSGVLLILTGYLKGAPKPGWQAGGSLVILSPMGLGLKQKS